jgi:threonine aldolase
MAQQIAMRLHAQDRGVAAIAFHPTCHLELHEHGGYGELHGLRARLVGRREGLLETSELEALLEPVAALLLELPQREIGGQLPSWDALVEQADWARGRGVALHLDGARLWESAPFYGRAYADIAALFDSVYVSFYKGLGAIAGAILAGSREFVGRARIWQRRHGGNLVSMYPLALSARDALERRLGKMGEYHRRALEVAELMRALPGVQIVPDPPHTNMFHAHVAAEPERLLEASAAIAEARGVALLTRVRATPLPRMSAIEVAMGDGVSAFEELELKELLEQLFACARA